MRRRCLAVAALAAAACSDPAPPGTTDAVAADAALADAAPADAGFDARPPDDRAVVVDPLVAFPEPIPGPAFTRVFGGLAWNGSSFVLQDDGVALAAVDADRAITAQRIGAPQGTERRRLACSPSGPCGLAWQVTNAAGDAVDVHVAVTSFVDPDDGAVPATSGSMEMESFLAEPQLGAHGTGFIAVGEGADGPLVGRYRLDGTPLDAAPIVVFTPMGFSNLLGIACDAIQCTVYREVCASECLLQLRRFRADGTIDPELVVPAISNLSHLGCTAGTCAVIHFVGGWQLTLIAPDGTLTAPTPITGFFPAKVTPTPDGFVVTGFTNAPVVLTAVRVGLDGSVGPPLAVVPLSSPTIDPLIACGTTTCMAAIGGTFGVLGLIRFTATESLDEDAVVPTVPTRQRAPRVATDGARFFIEWSREAASWTSNSVANRRGAVWDPATGWSAATSGSTAAIPSLWTRPVMRAITWNGEHYVAVTREGSHSRVGFYTATAVPSVELFIPAELDDLGCLDTRCLATGPGGWALLNPNGTIDRELEFTGGASRSTPLVFRHHDQPAFAFARRDNQTVTLAILAPDGLSETILPVSAGSSVDAGQPIVATLVGDRIVVAWRAASGATFGRAVGPDLAVGPLTSLAIAGDWRTVTAAPLGDNALFVIYDPALHRYTGVRFDPQLDAVGDAFPVSPPTQVTETETPRLASAGDHAVLVWSRFDPALGAQLAVVPLHLE